MILQDGKVSAFRKSELIPTENNEAVKVVVGDSFEDMVLNSTKNGVLCSSLTMFLIMLSRP